MGEAMAGTYYCHMCSQAVGPIADADDVRCPYCDSGFLEEMTEEISRNLAGTHLSDDPDDITNPDRSLSLWAPILLGMMGPRPRRRRSRITDTNDTDTTDDREFHALLRRRRRSSAILQLLQTLDYDVNNPENRENVILINPGDYLIGPGLDMLLQHLAESDPSRYGTPPAKKEAVEAMATVKVEENLNCSVCLEDFAIGEEAREMPCKHKFHGACILPWLEIHSSCPVCRFQIPADEMKRGDDGETGDGSGGDGDGAVPWSFRGMFTSVRGSSSANPENYDRGEEN